MGGLLLLLFASHVGVLSRHAPDRLASQVPRPSGTRSAGLGLDGVELVRLQRFGYRESSRKKCRCPETLWRDPGLGKKNLL